MQYVFKMEMVNLDPLNMKEPTILLLSIFRCIKWL